MGQLIRGFESHPLRHYNLKFFNIPAILFTGISSWFTLLKYQLYRIESSQFNNSIKSLSSLSLNVSIYFLAVYLISLTVLLLHWITNNNKCIITEYHNRLINIDENIGFRDFIQILSNKYPTSGEPLSDLTVRSKIIYGYIMTIGVITGLLIYFK